jgi:hypothetical protein
LEEKSQFFFPVALFTRFNFELSEFYEFSLALCVKIFYPREENEIKNSWPTETKFAELFLSKERFPRCVRVCVCVDLSGDQWKNFSHTRSLTCDPFLPFHFLSMTIVVVMWFSQKEVNLMRR